MPILNYTTAVSVERTVGEIMGLLASRGARNVSVTYSDRGLPIGIAFSIATPFGERWFRLPVRVESVWKVLTRARADGSVQPRFATREQAARVGWRIVKDWLAAQVALIEVEMASLGEVMLPYMQTEPGGATVYEVVEQQRLLLPPSAEQEER